MTSRNPTRVRRCNDRDAEALVAILTRVHERDHYPVRPVNVRWGWLVEAVDAAWTALVDDLPVGHVGVAQPAEGSLLPPGALEVTRLFVDPDVRRSGAAGLLLDTVESHAASAGCPLGLEVVAGSDAAIAFYGRRGWRPIGERTATWAGDDGVSPTLLGYLA